MTVAAFVRRCLAEFLRWFADFNDMLAREGRAQKAPLAAGADRNCQNRGN